jgi:hypothetical protein
MGLLLSATCNCPNVLRDGALLEVQKSSPEWPHLPLARAGRALAAAAPAVSIERLQCRTMDPLSVPELTPVAWIAVLCNVMVPVVWAKRPVPPVMV